MISEETREKWRDKIDVVVKSYEYGCIELNDWEQKFMDNIQQSFIYENKDLTFPQSKCLNKIYGRIE